MDTVQVYLVVAVVYGLFGAALSTSYYLCPRLREEPAYHAFTVVLLIAAAVLATLGTSLSFRQLAAFHFGVQFFLFLAASLCYVPAVVFLILHYTEMVLERILSPGSRREPPRHPLTQPEQWSRIELYLGALARDPADGATRERLADMYAQMGFLDSALYEYQKSAEWLDRGYMHSHVLYKAARLIVERKQDIPGAVILLRRIVRLYPKSYFAAYARRILNHYEAHHGVSTGGISTGGASAGERADGNP